MAAPTITKANASTGLIEGTNYTTDYRTGLVYDWNFDGVSDGFTLSNTSYETGLFDQSLDFNGTNSYGQLAHNANQNPSDMYLCFWMKRNATGSGTSTPMIWKFDGGDGWHVNMQNATVDGRLFFRVIDTSANTMICESDAITDTNWHFIECILDGTAKSIRTYIDRGNTVTDSSVSWNGLAATTDLYLGSVNGASNFYDGNLDAVRLYNAIPSDANKDIIHQATLAYVQGVRTNSTFNSSTELVSTFSVGDTVEVFNKDGNASITAIKNLGSTRLSRRLGLSL